MSDFLEYYSRSEVQKAILESSKDREIAVMIGDKGFGKRPETINYETDVLELVKNGATSFHVSEEHWKNPQHLSSGMNKKQLNKLRSGWDFILDIDSPKIEYSKTIAYYLIQALKFYNIKNVSIKYSGNKGFHIGIPFKAFPDTINNNKTIELFPEAARIMAEFLTEMIKPYLSEKIKDDIEKVLKIDTVLISNRHLYRAPYSLHEKTGLVSIPINPEKVLDFNKNQALPGNIDIKIKFLSNYEESEAEYLIKRAFEWFHEKELRQKAFDEIEDKSTKGYSEVTDAIPEEFFPNCMKQGLKGLKDGRKRFLFVLINFLKCVNWDNREIVKKVKEWNNNNPEPLKEGYILSQLQWHQRQKEKILPPNYSNTSYYRDLGLDCSGDLNNKIKNPVNYAIKRYKISRRRRKKQ